MLANQTSHTIATFHILIQALLVVRILIRPHREPASRIAWLAVVIAAPVIGIIAYLLLGEVRVGRRRVKRSCEILAKMPKLAGAPGTDQPAPAADVSQQAMPAFRITGSINGFHPLAGNSANLMLDSNAAIDSMVSDIDCATNHVHLIFYIWLADNNGTKIADALIRAARRGVTCRAMVDDLGSRKLVRSQLWNQMRDAGVRLATSLALGNILLKPLHGRIDLRDHRKILIIDDQITYCGSQNCADPEFRVKARFAPWVDLVLRFTGPVARQNQHIFALDWMTQVDEDLSDILRRPLPVFSPGFTAMAFGTGPTTRNSAMPEVFEILMYSAKKELVVTTPYYVPTETMQAALCSSARRGVSTTIIFPARNDSWIVAGASRSYYEDLLDAGVQIFEYVGGLLHAKTLTVDGEMSLIGSANMDRRSFELNFENNILLNDSQTTAAIRQRQADFLASSKPVDRTTVDGWSMPRRLWNNAVAMLGPIL